MLYIAALHTEHFLNLARAAQRSAAFGPLLPLKQKEHRARNWKAAHRTATFFFRNQFV